MSSKLIFLLLTALLLVQCSIGKPMPDADTAAELSKEEETKNECNAEGLRVNKAFRSFLTDELIEFINIHLISAKDFGDNLLAEVDDWEEISEDLKNKIDKFTEYRNKLAEAYLKDKNTGDARFGLLREMAYFLDMFNTTTNDQPNDEDSAIAATINRFDDEFEGKVLRFSERLYVAGNKFLDSLCPEIQNQFEYFAEWLINFKNETDANKRYDLFAELYGM